MNLISTLSTLIIDPGYTLIIGALFGLRAIATFRARPLLMGSIACALAGIGLPVIAYLKEPAWMWMYYVDPAQVPTAMVAYAFVILYVPAFFVGFYVTAHLKETSRGRAWLFFLGTLLFEGALIFFLWDRYSVVGTMAQWQAGKAPRLWESDLGKSLNFLFAGAAVLTLILWILAKPRIRTPRV
jgi:hypothetical protein